LIGGAARGRIWNQIVADVYGLPVQRLAFLEEATSMGAALTGGIGVGLYPDFSTVESMNQVVEVFKPDSAAQAVYETVLPIFEASYRALAPIYEMIAEAQSRNDNLPQ
jgi:xylulokinase